MSMDLNESVAHAADSGTANVRSPFPESLSESDSDSIDLDLAGSYIFIGLPELADFTVKTGGTLFRVQKQLLIQYSDYFRAMLSREFTENKENKVELNDSHPARICLLLDFMHSASEGHLPEAWVDNFALSIEKDTSFETERFGFLFSCLELADEFQAPLFTAAILAVIKRHARKTSPQTFALICTTVYSKEDVRVSDEAFKAVLRDLCATEFRTCLCHARDPYFIDMLKSTPDLAAAMALAYHENDAPSSRKHYLAVMCENDGCDSKHKRWWTTTPEDWWTDWLHCLWCGQTGLVTRLEEDPDWKSNRRFALCDSAADPSLMCGPDGFYFSANVAYEKIHCVECGQRILVKQEPMAPDYAYTHDSDMEDFDDEKENDRV